MGDVTGPISTLSGASHDVPDGMTCDEHPDRPAVARIQGETDSFGCEMIDMCQECLDADRAWRKSPEAAEWRKGVCEWCKNPADDLRDARDYEEGSCGRVYRICGACKKRDNDYWAAEAAAYDDDRYEDYGDDDDGDVDDPLAEAEMNCSKMPDGQCGQAGSECCDFVCPFRDEDESAEASTITSTEGAGAKP
jgi:hypothetical protein